MHFYIAVSILKVSKYSDQGRVTIVLDDACVKLARQMILKVALLSSQADIRCFLNPCVWFKALFSLLLVENSNDLTGLLDVEK